MNPNRLTQEQQVVAEKVLAEEAGKREHLVLALSGAHAYGFPSPDSDLDLKGIHIDPTERLVGLASPASHANRFEIVDGVEIDYSSNEIGPVLLGILQGNGNYVERVLGPILMLRGAEHEGVASIVKRAISKRIFRHYAGFASNQLRTVEQAEVATVKKVLYVLRTALTGTHVLLTGEVVTDVTELLDQYGFSRALALVDAKRAGERTPMSSSDRAHWSAEVRRAVALLEASESRSPLPNEPANTAEVEAWLLELRRRRWS
jgi:predicted nucleotidyltransferase